ncbi:anaerobic dehydrogenase, typically selenocysteine-containing [Desulfosporosinus acidiphilus SJ4]|uniref:Anaerobic dehydrogenase, typically selenocysteine-containing n=1 Tax=Desulfosporosinus acidiphilus (strain DSM 22704 / JCM 16185 / SJ4) TaxID=646529 RepID=I4DCH9_DESAJ|nr:molybdopterin-dependent oxidoreductase [Desulfosporosinus acidiphilus]AFM43503.1 anaerobic dehydrogenase, typically selenocysteine-containing [Desulfosporosinus acidiphilus SJ4]
MTMVRSACPLNCPDGCAFLVEKRENSLLIKGDPANNITKGFICSKGQALGKRVFSPDRLKFPLLRQGQRWERVSWDQAYLLLTEAIKKTLDDVGPWGIFHHYDYGSNGVLRELDQRFFQALGGVTEPRGSMCWGAGYQAQELDFGGVFSNSWEDLEDAKTIVLWGRDPAVTNVHLIPHLLGAKKRGARVLVINPIRVKSAEFADEYYQVRPGTDGALALGLSHIILRERWQDTLFIQNYIQGFEGFARRAKEFFPEKVAAITGVGVTQLTQLARAVSHAGPVSIILGYGLQRYIKGGNAVRAIDGLAAISGNIGWAGAGVHYAHQYHQGKMNSVLLPPERYRSRTYPHPILAEELLKADPAIQLAVVTRSNPLVQQPNSQLWRDLWRKIPFKVVIDTVLTETARQSDLVLPAATIFEEEDLVKTSWSPLIHYAQKVLEPQGEVQAEPVIFTELAKRLGIEKDFPYASSREWLEFVLQPLSETYEISLDKLAQGPVYAPYIPKVAWENKDFKTPSGKIELSSELDLADLGEAVEFPYHLLTPHPGNAMHSQFHQDEGFKVFLHPDLAEKFRLNHGDQAIVETAYGQLVAAVVLSEDIHPETVVLPEGTTSEGLGVNQLILGKCSDIGESTCYYEMRCQIRKWYLD